MTLNYEYLPGFSTAWLIIIAALTGFLIFKPRNIVFPYLATLLIFASSSTYGTLEGSVGTIYSRGGGVLLVPLLATILYGLFFYALLIFAQKARRRLDPSVVTRSLAALCIITAGFFCYGLVADIALKNILSMYGMINIINLFLFFLVIRWWLFDEQQLDRFVTVFSTLTTFMAIFGLVRWAGFGGDPANYYRNFEGSNLSITFFDNGQGVLFACLFVLLYNKIKMRLVPINRRTFYYIVMGLCLFSILLSFRRALWLGFALVLAWIFFTSNAGRRVFILGLAMIALVVGGGIYQERFAQSDGSGLSQITSDVSGGIESGRFTELYYAVQVSNEKFLFGLGPWGRNQPRVAPSWDNDFVHSSIIHVYIKLGIVGTVLYISMFAGYVAWWIRRRRKKWGNVKYLAYGDAFFCGFLMEVPDLLFGTPLIIFRHSQILAIILAMPAICYALDKTVKAPAASRLIAAKSKKQRWSPQFSRKSLS